MQSCVLHFCKSLVCWTAQLCTEELWAAIMGQVGALDMSQQALPEEAMTQMYQARPLLYPFCSPGTIASMHTSWRHSC